VTARPTGFVIIDPSEELADILAGIEDRLLCSEPDTSIEQARLAAAAGAAGTLAVLVRRDQLRQRRLLAPGGTDELGPLHALDVDLPATVAALRAASGDFPAGELRAVGLLERCARHATTHDMRPLLAAARSTVEPTVLDAGGWLAYRRLVADVLPDPLERFIALPQPRPLPAPAPAPAPDLPATDLGLLVSTPSAPDPPPPSDGQPGLILTLRPRDRSHRRTAPGGDPGPAGPDRPDDPTPPGPAAA